MSAIGRVVAYQGWLLREVTLYVYHYKVHAMNECVGCLIVMVYYTSQ